MEFQGTVEIDRLLAERPGLHGIEYLVRWKNYNHYGDTWEPHEHIYPPSKLTTFYSRPTIQVSLTIPVWLLRDSIARQCSQRKISERGPVFRRTVPVDGLIVPEVGKAVIDHIRRLFSPPLPLDRSTAGVTKLVISDLDNLSEIVGFHIARPEHRAVGAGALRIKSGEHTYEDMMMVFELILTYKESEPKFEVESMGGRSFSYQISTVVFHGDTGLPDWPHMPNGKDKEGKVIGEDLRLLDEERQHIVTHAKQELRQRWAPMPIPHRLLTRCWHLLPAEKWSLPQSKSNAREKKPKPKPKPIIAKMAWRGRGERVQRRKLLGDVDV